MPKVPVWSTVGGAFAFVWRERKRFAALAFAPVLFASLITVLFLWAMPVETMMEVAQGQRSMAPMVIGIFAVNLITALLWVTFSVAWHRRYLMPGEDVTIGQALMWRMRQTRFGLRFIGIGLLVTVIWIFGGGAFGLMGWATESAASDTVKTFGGILSVTAIFAMMIFAFLAFARLSLWLPAAAVEAPLKMTEVWRITRGNGWRLIAITALVAIPFAITGAVLQLLFFPAFSGPDAYSQMMEGGAPVMMNMGLTVSLLVNLLYMTYYYISIAVGVTALSIAYRRLTGGGTGGEGVDITA